MPLVKIPQNSFTRGEFDPELLGRDDLKIRNQGLKRALNIVLKAQGGFRRRYGSYPNRTLAHSKYRLAPFVFADAQRYLFAFFGTGVDIYNGQTGALLTTVLGCPWVDAQLSSLYWTSSGDITVITHTDFPPHVIRRTGASTFTQAPFAFGSYNPSASTLETFYPYYKWQPVGVTLKPSNYNAFQTHNVVCNTPGFFTATMAAEHYQFLYKGKPFICQSLVNSTTMSVTNLAALPQPVSPFTGETEDFSYRAFQGTDGFPRCCLFHAQRLYFLGHRKSPDAWWASAVGGYFDFRPGTGLDSDGLQVAIGAERVCEIRAATSTRHLQVFTSEGPFFNPSTDTKEITASNAGMKRQSPYGVAANVRPREYDGGTLFLQKNSTTLRDFVYDQTYQSYTSNSPNLLASHLLNAPLDMEVVTPGAIQRDQILYVLNGNGTMAQYLQIRDEQLAGWVGWSTAGIVRHICAVESELFMIVERVIGGVTKWTLEQTDWQYRTLDCATILSGASSATWPGLSLYANQLVTWIAADGSIGTATVSGAGVLTLPAATTSVQVGFDFQVLAEIMPLITNLPDGPATSVMRSIPHTIIRFKDTVNAIVGGQKLEVRYPPFNAASPMPPFTGQKEFWHQGWSQDPTIVITQDKPQPLEVLSMTCEMRY